VAVLGEHAVGGVQLLNVGVVRVEVGDHARIARRRHVREECGFVILSALQESKIGQTLFIHAGTW